MLQASKSDVTVVAFLIFPAKTNNFNVESLRGHAVTKSLRDTLNEIQSKMGKRMYEICLRYFSFKILCIFRKIQRMALGTTLIILLFNNFLSLDLFFFLLILS